MGRERQYSLELTDRQREVIALVARGHTNAEIAERLGISLAGAKWHVSELLQKLGVDSREDLADRWREDSSIGARLSRAWAGIAGVLALKPVAGVMAGSLVVAAVAGAGIAYGLGGRGDSDIAAQVTEEATPTPAPTPVPTATLPAAPGAIWTANEALARAETVANAELASRARSFAAPQTVGQLPLVSATWHVAITRYESPNGDNYWDRSDGARNAWAFFWKQDAVRSAGLDFVEGTLEVEVLIEDGKEMLAYRTLYMDPANPPPYGRMGSGFFSRTDIEYMHNERRLGMPAGPDVQIGWHNGVPGSVPLVVYPSNRGDWCVIGRNADATTGSAAWCAYQDGPHNGPISHNLTTTFKDGVMGDIAILVATAPEVVRVVVLKEGSAEQSFETYAAPSASEIARRFAWLNIGKAPDGVFTIVGYDAAGSEVARTANEPIGPPPPNPPARP